jgi:transcriptional regulator with XRE-family HTH domain
MDYRSLRLALELRQIDVQRATGISADRISQAERGLVQLTDRERRSIENFLRARLRSEIEPAGEAE